MGSFDTTANKGRLASAILLTKLRFDAYPNKAPPLAATIQAIMTYGVVRPGYRFEGPEDTMPPTNAD